MIARLLVATNELKFGHAPTATYVKLFGQRDDDQCWWCGAGAQTQEHLLRHCRQKKNEQCELWKPVARAADWRVGWYKHVQTSELFSLGIYDQTVTDFLTTTEVGKFPCG